MYKDTSLLLHARFISLPRLGGKSFHSIIEWSKGLAVNFDFGEMADSLLDEFP